MDAWVTRVILSDPAGWAGEAGLRNGCYGNGCYEIGIRAGRRTGVRWGSGLPINPNNFNNYKRGCFFTSVAGVIANYLLAFIAYPLFVLSVLYLPTFGYFTDVIINVLRSAFCLSLVFFVFNLIPVYPLDGFRALDVFSKKRSKIYWFLRTKGIYVLYALFALSLFADITDLYYVDILGIAINKVATIISKPITLFWGLIIS